MLNHFPRDNAIDLKASVQSEDIVFAHPIGTVMPGLNQGFPKSGSGPHLGSWDTDGGVAKLFWVIKNILHT